MGILAAAILTLHGRRSRSSHEHTIWALIFNLSRLRLHLWSCHTMQHDTRQCVLMFQQADFSCRHVAFWQAPFQTFFWPSMNAWRHSLLSIHQSLAMHICGLACQPVQADQRRVHREQSADECKSYWQDQDASHAVGLAESMICHLPQSHIQVSVRALPAAVH